MQNLYKKLLSEVLLLELPLLRAPKRTRLPARQERKNPFRWIIVDSYSKHMGNSAHNHIITRLWE